MYFTVTCDGVPIGATELEGWGVRAGLLAPLLAFAAFGLQRPARRLGVAFLATLWSRVPAATAARAWRAASAQIDALEPRLGLVDASGAAVPFTASDCVALRMPDASDEERSATALVAQQE